MENLKFDLTTQDGLINTQEDLKKLINHRNTTGEIITVTDNLTLDVDIEGMFKNLINMISMIFKGFFNLFDDTEKLEKQMELATKTIEIARAGGAKSIDITLNSKNEGNLNLLLKKIDAKIGGKVEKDNTITYSIKF
ncbi:hypothetical protein [Winogradskyella bathintestinalis]|uniref:Uncharacterized protein n=1 Tax=Winogradskyella bathintestinalis TaxID=3035208 RepID=A0ABT7ZYX6_9FLAO|nr:hypothetical protein [Winogradskyella bathintestinalis]MDN3494209.1 hypothetical protein [Winogradskyella bathintestinalis]